MKVPADVRAMYELERTTDEAEYDGMVGRRIVDEYLRAQRRATSVRYWLGILARSVYRARS